MIIVGGSVASDRAVSTRELRDDPFLPLIVAVAWRIHYDVFSGPVVATVIDPIGVIIVHASDHLGPVTIGERTRNVSRPVCRHCGAFVRNDTAGQCKGNRES